MSSNDDDAKLATSIKLVAERLRDAERIVWLTGAGLSVASGIAPYRDSADAVWSRFVTEWGTISCFRRDPLAWWKEYWLKSHGDLLTKTFEPNAGHHAIATLLEHRTLDVVITQNIDGLHRASGVLDAQLMEVHGRHDRFCCTNARCQVFRFPVHTIDLAGLEEGHAPRCPACNAHLRPLVLLFDEQYLSHHLYRWNAARRALKRADAIVFVGTSYAVGVTQHALDVGKHRALVNVNTVSAREFGIDVDGLRMCDVLGLCEESLPALATALEVEWGCGDTV